MIQRRGRRDTALVSAETDAYVNAPLSSTTVQATRAVAVGTPESRQTKVAAINPRTKRQGSTRPTNRANTSAGRGRRIGSLTSPRRESRSAPSQAGSQTSSPQTKLATATSSCTAAPVKSHTMTASVRTARAIQSQRQRPHQVDRASTRTASQKRHSAPSAVSGSLIGVKRPAAPVTARCNPPGPQSRQYRDGE